MMLVLIRGYTDYIWNYKSYFTDTCTHSYENSILLGSLFDVNNLSKTLPIYRQ